MGVIDFNSLLTELLNQAKEIAASTFKDYKKQAAEDAESLISGIKPKLERWTLQVANGDISKDDLEFLLMGEKELVEMKALKQVGIALIKLDELKIKILKSIVNSIASKI
ncbi:hypothetical protein [uncultured Bacteroides sp.]|uniref:hypothetical protein n=1 Tax=uncultured Bacteroides sp. TaxID=162156 RepID=UPI002AAAB5E4|nr:hypothetical protein [uncultured Bacteroides sp.]